MHGRKIFAVVSSNRIFGVVIMITAWFFACVARPAYATDNGPRFCIVPVKDGVPTGADVGEAWGASPTYLFASQVFPASSSHPRIEAASGRSTRIGGWCLTLVFFRILFSTGGRWVFEPWSSRIIAATTFGGVSVLKPGAAGFEEFDNGHSGNSSASMFCHAAD